jgi:hypothetical protein
MKILAMLYVIAYFTRDAQATAAAQNATEEEEYYCE